MIFITDTTHIFFWYKKFKIYLLKKLNDISTNITTM